MTTVDATNQIQSFGRSLPELSESVQKDIALALLSENFFNDVDLRHPQNLRRQLIATARRMDIEPNRMLSFMYTLLVPKLAELFKPITEQEVKEEVEEKNRRDIARREREKKSKIEQDASRQVFEDQKGLAY